MGIPLDIEDILSAGCLASIGRGLATLSCLWLGAATGTIAVGFASVGAEWLQGGGLPIDLTDYLLDVLISCAFGPFVLVQSFTLFFFFPLILAVYFVFARGENGTVVKWVVLAAITGLLAFLSYQAEFAGNVLCFALSAVLWIGLAASLGSGAFLLTAWQRRRMVTHLQGVAAENDQRRKVLSDAFGIAVGDREFATGDLNVLPSSAGRANPKPPVPGSNEDGK